MARAPRVCNIPDCPDLTDTGGRCTAHTKAADKARGTAHTRGYTSRGHLRFRRLVLQRDPLCVLCGKVATVADHYPLSRRDLVDQGLNPNNPDAGRGLCASCHSSETARHQPGGWNQGA